MARSFVSVLIDTYNHEKFIEQAIVSVLEQDFPEQEREVIVVDDGSTDRTPEIVRKFEPRVRLLRKANGGQASAFNAGIPECKGEIVAFLDGDDWWAAKKLSCVAEAMEKDSSVGIVGHGIFNVQRDGSEVSETLREGHRFRANGMEGARLLRRRGAFLGTSRMTIRTELLRKIGSVPEAIEIQADEYLFTLASVLKVAWILPEMLTYYRMHEGNAFQLAVSDPQKLRRKQRALAVLAGALSDQLKKLGMEEEMCCVVTDYTQASADQLRLQLDGGWSSETIKTEWKIYRILHPDASISHKAFKIAILAGALLVSPKYFYKIRQMVADNSLYLRARARWLPVPEMKHIQKDWHLRS